MARITKKTKQQAQLQSQLSLGEAEVELKEKLLPSLQLSQPKPIKHLTPNSAPTTPIGDRDPPFFSNTPTIPSDSASPIIKDNNRSNSLSILKNKRNRSNTSIGSDSSRSRSNSYSNTAIAEPKVIQRSKTDRQVASTTSLNTIFNSTLTYTQRRMASPKPELDESPNDAEITLDDDGHSEISNSKNFSTNNKSKNADAGFLSSIFNVAHNAAANMMSSTDENNEKNLKMIGSSPNNTSASLSPQTSSNRGNKLDSLLKVNKSKNTGGSSVNSKSSKDEDDQITQDNSTLSPNNIHFSSVRESPINTLGQGDLLLSNFDAIPEPRGQELQSQPQSMTGLPMDNAGIVPAQGPNSTGLTNPNQGMSINALNNLKGGRSGSLKRPIISPNVSTDLLPLHKIVSPSDQLQSTPANQLATSGNNENKRVHRKSFSYGTPNIGGLEKLKSKNFSLDDIFNNTNNQEEDIESGSTISDKNNNEEVDHVMDFKDLKLANEKKNKEFHQVFKKISNGEKLIHDASCALSKDILIQGRMYISEHYVCFNSNILGWVTNLIIPLQEVIQIEKKSTAGLFPNGMVIRTLHHKYVFATFLSRDSSFNIIISVWKQVLSEDPNRILNMKNSRERGASKSTYYSSHLNEETDSGVSGRLRAFSTGDDSSEDINVLDDFAGDSHDSGEEEDDDLISDDDDEDDDDPSLSSLSLKAGANNAEDQGGYSTEEGSLNDEEPDNILDNDNQARKTSTSKSKDSSTPSTNGGNGDNYYGLPTSGPLTHPPTDIEYTKQSNENLIIEDVIKAPLGTVYQLLFGNDRSRYIKILTNQGNFEILENDITELNTKTRERHYTYIKPLNAPIGPKQTKCLIADKLIEFELKKYVLVEQITSTPDVPSGNSFQVKTKVFLYWGDNNQTRIYVVTLIEWSGKSWIKGAIEKGTIDGQKDSMRVMVDSLNEMIELAGTNKLKSNGKKKKGKSSKKKKVATKKPRKLSVGAETVKTESINEQLNKLIELIGKLIPIGNFIGDLIKGYLMIFMIFLTYTLIIRRKGPNKHQIEILPQEQVLLKISINNHKYYIVPSSESYLDNQEKRIKNEVKMWDWLRDRSDGKINVDNNTDDGKEEEDYLQEYSKQEMKEIVKLTQLKLDQISQQFL